MNLAKSDHTKQYFSAFYKQNCALLILSLLFTILCFPANLIGSWLLGQVIDAIAEESMDRLRTITLVSIAFIVMMFFFTILLYWFKSKFIRKALIQYKDLAFRKISEKNISSFSRENAGSYISMLSNDAASIEENYLKKSFLILHYILLFFGTLIMMLRYSVVLTVATIILGFLPAIASILMGKELSYREKEVSDKNEMFVSQLKELLSGFSVIKSFQAEKEAQEIFSTTNEKLESSKCARYWWECLLSAVSQNLSGDLMQFGIFIFGAYLAIHGNISAGTVLMFFNLCNFIIMPVNIIPQYFANREAARGLIEKLSNMTVNNLEYYGEGIEIIVPNQIVFRDVKFSYESKYPILKKISFSLEGGKKYALVGASGSGKSTILNILMGARKDYQGSITIGGRQLRDINALSLHRLISLVDQTVFIFNDTILRNITMYSDFSVEIIEQAVLRAGLMPLIEQRGYDYVCGENGVNLSGGEKQRISIARCLIRGTPIILFDEATSSLDKDSSYAITQEILRLEEITRIVVSHQLNETLLRQYDEVIVIRDGMICEHGKYDELMEKKSYLYSLYHVENG